MNNYAGNRISARNQRGAVMVLVLMLLLLFTAMGLLLMYMITSTVKSSGLLRSEEAGFYGAEGGVLAIAAYMTAYHRTDFPINELQSLLPGAGAWSATYTPLGPTIMYPVGYSTLWTGVSEQIDGVSPPTNSTSEVEAVVFIPVSPVGYGNE